MGNDVTDEEAVHAASGMTVKVSEANSAQAT